MINISDELNVVDITETTPQPSVKSRRKASSTQLSRALQQSISSILASQNSVDAFPSNLNVPQTNGRGRKRGIVVFFFVISFKAIDQFNFRHLSKRIKLYFFVGRRNPTVDNDIIDLVSCPILTMPGVVNLDSDDEINEIREKATSTDSPQLDNNEIKIHVNFGMNVEEFEFRRVSF